MQKKKSAPKKAKVKATKKPSAKKVNAEASPTTQAGENSADLKAKEELPEQSGLTAKKGRDNSAYIYQGAEYKKGRLVHKIISDHVAAAKGKMTYEQLRAAWPESTQKRFTVFKKSGEIEAFNSAGRERFFSKPEELIKLKNATIAVTNQWTAQSLAPFLKVAASLGYKVKIK